MKPKLCKICHQEIPKGLNNTCGPKCERKKQDAKEKERKATAKLKKSVSVSVLGKRADTLWSEAVKLNYGHKCQYCGSTSYLNSHHLFTRSRRNTRWDIENGICLCSGHHTLSSEFSAHLTSLEFFIWIEQLKGRPFIERLSKKSQGILKVTPEFLQETIKELEKFIESYKI